MAVWAAANCQWLSDLSTFHTNSRRYPHVGSGSHIVTAFMSVISNITDCCSVEIGTLVEGGQICNRLTGNS
jgi:hypothetical protein